MILKISFPSLSNANIKFAESRKLIYRLYTIVEVLSTISFIKLIDKREFIRAALIENIKTFVIYIATLKAINSVTILINPSWIT